MLLLKNTTIKWNKKKCMTIVLCSKGYPNNYKKNQLIKNMDKINIEKNNFIFHAGTKLVDGKLLSNGGRVLNFSRVGENFFYIRKKIILLIRKIKWKNGFFRKDIGWRVINKNANY